MSTFRIARANIQFPPTPEESVTLAEQAVAQAATERADLICFPECVATLTVSLPASSKEGPTMCCHGFAALGAERSCGLRLQGPQDTWPV